MRSTKLRVALVLVLTLSAFWGLLTWDPFRRLDVVFVKREQVQEDALVKEVFTDPNTQETSGGQRPLVSLRQLEAHWCSVRKESRYVLIGNSQTLTVLLAPSEARPTKTERTYPDLLLDRLKASGASTDGYRLSAPNISYMEVLWYLRYLLVHPCLTPDELVVQLNFETFRKTGIRDGMLELLEDPDFLKAAELEAQSDAPYANTFQQAIDRHRSRLAKEKGSETGASLISQTGLMETRGFGGFLETKIRAALDEIPQFKARAGMKGEFLEFLYLVRVNVLGITPTTKRSLGGGTLIMNVSSLERVGKLCKQNDVRLVFFNAPQNPDAPLYRTLADREQYLSTISKLSRDFGSAYFDFESSIPRQMWGVWIDGPDPIHFGRQAHRRLADLMFESKVIGRPN